MNASDRESQSEPRDAIISHNSRKECPENIILSSLRFPCMHDRLRAVETAHANTCNWIFKEDKTHQWHSFAKWLSGGSGIFWISGKPGSGKSVLMRHIFEEERTRSLLQQWSCGEEILAVTVFLWKNGLPDQASQSGLLRSLLYAILKRKANFIKEVFPDERESMKQEATYSKAHNHKIRWNLANLKTGFQRLFQQDLGRICIFVDGLDEYGGDPKTLIDLFEGITTENPNVKVCLSSRPSVEFADGFVDTPQLQLQDLTYEDLEVYIEDTLLSSSKMKELCAAEPNEVQKLVEKIASNSSGVFLWVKLVVLTILNSLDLNDGISTLQKWLDSVPKEIEPFYDYMLESIDPINKDEGQRIFELVQTCREIFKLSELNFQPGQRDIVTRGHQRLSVDPLLLCIAKDWSPKTGNCSVDIIQSSQEIRNRLQEIKDSLQKSCAGLLELVPILTSGLDTASHSQEESIFKVEYIHRTAAEYLEERKSTKFFVTHRSTNTKFNANLSLFAAQSFLLQNHNRLPFIYSIGLEYKAILAMLFVSRAYQESDDSSWDLLEDFGSYLKRQLLRVREINQPTDFHWGHRFLQLLTTGSQLNWPDTLSEKTAELPYIVSLAVVFGMTSFVELKLAQLESRHREKLFSYYLTQACTSRALANTKMVSLLINHGARLSWIDWRYVLVASSSHINKVDPNESNMSLSPHEQMTLFGLLLETGADPFITFTLSTESERLYPANHGKKAETILSLDAIFNSYNNGYSNGGSHQYHQDHEKLLSILKSNRTPKAWIKHWIDVKRHVDKTIRDLTEFGI